MNKEQKELYNEIINKYLLDELQKEQIELGIIEGINVFIYSNPEFNNKQMKEIRLGLKIK